MSEPTWYTPGFHSYSGTSSLGFAEAGSVTWMRSALQKWSLAFTHALRGAAAFELRRTSDPGGSASLYAAASSYALAGDVDTNCARATSPDGTLDV